MVLAKCVLVLRTHSIHRGKIYTDFLRIGYWAKFARARSSTEQLLRACILKSQYIVTSTIQNHCTDFENRVLRACSTTRPHLRSSVRRYLQVF
jgi:hypothetical protein